MKLSKYPALLGSPDTASVCMCYSNVKLPSPTSLKFVFKEVGAMFAKRAATPAEAEANHYPQPSSQAIPA
jgi:hypothetical protein